MWKKNLEVMKKYVFHKSERKRIIKHFAAKSFIVFGGAHACMHVRPLNTVKLFLQNVLLLFFTLIEYTFAIISRFFSQKFAGVIYQ